LLRKLLEYSNFQNRIHQKAFIHLEAFKKRARDIILDAIKEQLSYQPVEETHNKKLLRANTLADWELRIQRYGVFYEVDSTSHLVRIVAIGHKENNRLFIGREEISL
jgi:mRNA-degrading endonuclease RelE of RelBE toxin-antitoxin system